MIDIVNASGELKGELMSKVDSLKQNMVKAFTYSEIDLQNKKLKWVSEECANECEMMLQVLHYAGATFKAVKNEDEKNENGDEKEKNNS